MFHEKLDVKLIRQVKENPVLYDYTHEKYMDFNAREVAWQKIGDELKRPGLYLHLVFTILCTIGSYEFSLYTRITLTLLCENRVILCFD